MRVIAGAAKGHRLDAPRGRGTRPTSDRVREALFSSLQTRLPQARVADLYAGSGALGIEALSRGAATATFVEKARGAHRTIVANLERTGLAEDGAVIFGDVLRALRAGLPGGPFEIVFLDPPYDLDDLVLAEVLRLVAKIVAADGVVVVERARRAGAPRWPETLQPTDERRYGDTVLHIAHSVRS
jgi:16S rRNA (guanine966-N2)-methyltransferase